MPVLIGTLWESEAAARDTVKGDLSLVFCRDCGFIWNRVFDAARMEYSQTYENSLHFSDVFQRYTAGIVDRLVSSYDIRDKDVIDIGCGKGDFLAMLCEAGNSRGVGFDPSYEGDRVTGPVAERLTFVQDLYSERYANLSADIVTSRYVFEHVERPVQFLKTILSSLGDDRDALIYFEVPNVRLILEQMSVWDIIYEHCSYFGQESLAAAFERAGFGVLRVDEGYGRQFVSADARFGVPSCAASFGDLEQLRELVDEFSTNFGERLRDWRERFARFAADGRRVVAWGAGAKAVGFLNMLQIDKDTLPYVVDINPNKQGTYLGGTGQKVIAPQEITEIGPDVIILMNPIYQQEIAKQVTDLGLAVEFVPA